MEETTERASALAELLAAVGKPPIRTVPIAEHVGFSPETSEVKLRESSDVWISITERVLPSWARTARLTCIQMSGDSMQPADAALAVVDRSRRTPVDGQLFVVLVGDALAMKRCRQAGDQWSLASAGSDRSPKPLTVGDRIIGRVAWRSPHGVAAE